MTRHRTTTEFIHEGTYAVDVTIDLQYSDESWPATLFPADALKLDPARLALRRGNVIKVAT